MATSFRTLDLTNADDVSFHGKSRLLRISSADNQDLVRLPNTSMSYSTRYAKHRITFRTITGSTSLVLECTEALALDLWTALMSDLDFRSLG